MNLWRVIVNIGGMVKCVEIVSEHETSYDFIHYIADAEKVFLNSPDGQRSLFFYTDDVEAIDVVCLGEYTE